MTTITLEDGRIFPVYENKPLSWSIGLYMTAAESKLDYPRARTVAAAMHDNRKDTLLREQRDMVKASFCKIFGPNARITLKIIEDALASTE